MLEQLYAGHMDESYSGRGFSPVRPVSARLAVSRAAVNGVGAANTAVCNFGNRSGSSSVIGPRPVQPTPLLRGNLFAAPNGNGDGRSADNPASIYEALTHLTGETVLFLRGGTYHIRHRLRLNSASGRAGHPIIIESYPGERAILDGNYNSNAKGLELRHDNDYIAVRNIEVKRMVERGILVRGSHVVVEGCTVHDNLFSGIHVMDGARGYRTPFAEGYNIIRDNVIYNNSDVGLTGGNYNDGNNADGISISSGKFNIVTHNEVYGNSDDGIDSWRSNDTVISYNLVHGNGRGHGDGNGIKTGGELGPRPATGLRAYAHHNLSYHNRDDGFDLNAGTRVVWLYNTAYHNGRRGYSNITDDAVIKYNIAAANRIISRVKANTGDNSWQRSGKVVFMSTEPGSGDFLKPVPGSRFADIGAYAPIDNGSNYRF